MSLKLLWVTVDDVCKKGDKRFAAYAGILGHWQDA